MRRQWSKERVIQAIRQRQRRGLPLTTMCKDPPGLVDAAFRYFGSWRDAVLAAGGEPSLRTWTKSCVIAAILARRQAGLPITGVCRGNPGLYCAAYRHFGTWRNALDAAGLPPNPPRSNWTRERVIEAIQARHHQGLPLVGLQKLDRGLQYAARKHLGSWEQAVAAAGIPKGWKRQWDREWFLEMLREYAQPGERLSSTRVPATVATATYQWFSSWHDALAAAGLVPLEPRPARPRKWTKSDVLCEIRAGASSDGVIKANENRDLAGAARRHFGSWSAALMAAGLEARPLRSWSPERVLEELRARKERGEFAESTATPDRGLICAASRYFGSWRHALVVAGVLMADEKPRRKRKWPQQRVIEGVQDLYVRGLPLIPQSDRSLASAAIRQFGSWNNAVTAAGIPIGQKPEPNRHWTPQIVIQEILARSRQSLPLSCTWPGNRKLADASARHFGSWSRALVAAGIPGAAGPPEKWSPQRVLDELRAWDRLGRPGRKIRGNQRLSDAAYRYFGTWREALAAAGLKRANA